MKQLIESLKRLYGEEKITQEKLFKMLECGTITQEELDYIQDAS